ncbi:hypothetical protein MKX01_029588 [Papaver californicum]|nr:hypothetical protein MKX01_029588 [Papaver californicum]
MYRAPVFHHKLPTTDYLLVRSAKGKLFLRRIDRIHVVGQQEPHMEVISPGSKNLQTYIGNRLLVYMYRVCRANERRGMAPCIRADELAAQFPYLSEPILRKRLKHCADLQKGINGRLFWVIKRSFRIPVEEELRRLLTPENVCCYESMQAGLYRLKRLGVSSQNPTDLSSSAMNQLPDEAITLAASSHIERELQITPWNLTSNFITCTNQDRENIERLEITGVGDPSGRGLGFSYVRVALKSPISNAVVKKKIVAPRVGGTTVTGTDADLRRLNMDGAREVLLKFNVPEDTIAKQGRWHRIAMIRKLSSEQASIGVKVDSTTVGKYARGQRMSFLQLQQQAREKCQEIWDRQLQNLSAAEGDQNESDSEANSDLDSFAGDLENLLDAEECGEAEVGSNESKQNKIDGVRGLKTRRNPLQVQEEEEIEDEAAEAAELCRMLMDDNGTKGKKKKKTVVRGREELNWQRNLSAERINKTNVCVKQGIRTGQPDGSFMSMENTIRDQKELESILGKRNFSGIIKSKKGTLENDKVRKKHPSGKNIREGYMCRACGQAGHMRTNKNCPRYGEDLDTHVEKSGLERISGKLNLHDSPAQPKSTIKKIIPKIAARNVPAEASEKVEKTKTLQLKVKCGIPDKPLEQITAATQSSDKQDEMGSRTISKYSKTTSNKMKPEGFHGEPQKQPSIVILPPLDTEKQPRKKIIIKQPKVDEVREEVHYGLPEEHRKTEKMMQLSSFEILRKQEQKRFADEAAAKRKAKEDKKFWEEENKRRVIREAKERERDREREVERERQRERILYQERVMQLEQNRLAEARRYHEALQQREKEELERQKMKKKKKVKLDETGDDNYLEEPRGYRTSRRMPERSRAAKKRPVESSARYGPEYGQQTKRHRGGEGQVGLSNALDNILDGLKNAEVSFLFLKPVSKKDAPDYLDIIEHPMDLSTITEKVRRMEYKTRKEFQQDVWQIAYNAHMYNANRNPGIPPLADQLLQLCDYFLDQYDERLTEAEAGI